jgi:hypothetical protein
MDDEKERQTNHNNIRFQVTVLKQYLKQAGTYYKWMRTTKSIGGRCRTERSLSRKSDRAVIRHAYFKPSSIRAEFEVCPFGRGWI